ncbi:MAG: DUF3488 and transglutaminase-like domain-containing protein [Planctomycetota bacterium]
MLLAIYLVTGGLLTTAFDASYLLLLPALATAAFLPLRRVEARAHVLVEVGMAGLAGAVATMLALREQNVALGLSLFLYVVMGVRLLAPRSDRERATVAAIGVVLCAVSASAAVDPSFALLLLLALGLQGVFLHQRNRRFRGIADHRRDAAAVEGPTLLRRERAPVALPNRGFGGRAPAGRRLLAWGAVAAAVLALTAGFFVSTPRLNTSPLAQPRALAPARSSGFSGTVRLDAFGAIRLDPRVAFRVELGQRPPTGEVPYWRGRAFDLYRRGSWSISPVFADAVHELRPGGDGQFSDPRFAPARREDLRDYAFFLEPLGTNVLFTPGSGERFVFEGGDPNRVTVDLLGNYATGDTYPLAIAYRARALPGAAFPQSLARSARAAVRRSCLVIPHDLDPARLEALARELLGPGRDPLRRPDEAAAQVETALRARCRYTLDRKRTPGMEPLEDFLYSSREGHCELFASSMVMLLRALGVPARLVTGFYGGDYDAWSQTYTVRQSSAHAWVEALTPAGWVRYDPTPPDERAAEPGALDRVRASLSWLELRWFNYVIAFDGYDQQRLARALGELFGVGEAATGAGAPRGLGLGLLAALLLLGVAWLWRRRRAGAGVPLAVRRLLSALERRGVARRADETLLEVARRGEQALGLPGALEPAVRDYYRARYGCQPAPADPLTRAAALVLSRPRARP